MGGRWWEIGAGGFGGGGGGGVVGGGGGGEAVVVGMADGMWVGVGGRSVLGGLVDLSEHQMRRTRSSFGVPCSWLSHLLHRVPRFLVDTGHCILLLRPARP